MDSVSCRSVFLCLLLISTFVSISHVKVCEAQAKPPIAKGLSWTFYHSTCPKLESIVRNELKKVFKKDIAQAAGLLRVHFHDCFVQSGGPEYDIPLGRRDGLTFATREVTLANLPAPSSNTTTILNSLATKNLDPTDVVSLSGGHTIGISHCSSFSNRLFPTQDPVMDKTFGKNLRFTCPTNTTNNTTVLDIRSPNKFDNKYYIDLMNRQGLFTSDQDLYTDKRTRGIVTSFAVNQSLFFEKFVIAMLKMGQLNVLTGNQGEIRANCSLRNKDKKTLLTSVMENVVEDLIEM
ncbi:hypothetical protein RJT34_24859 [Clitoria ternatea]|uniref:Peroxidase n=1 Tax=Clitoria ternatea TaxID=43366 RepID=A0AAN9FRG5_CLITE